MENTDARSRAIARNYRYYLESGTRQYRRHPAWCERKDCEFMPYRRTSTGAIVDADRLCYGVCNHSSSCGFSNYPAENKEDFVPDIQQPSIPTRKAQRTFADPEAYAKTTVRPCEFQRWLNFMFSTTMLEVWTRQGCHLGAGDSGTVYFWYVNRNQDLATAKVIQYRHRYEPRFIRRDTMKRNKAGQHYMIHRKLELDYQRILYGLGYITKDTQSVHIVESEKTVEIMRLALPYTNWLATGGSNNLCEEILRDVSEFDIYLWPDTNCMQSWAEFAARWDGQQDVDNGNTYKLHVIDWVDRGSYEAEDGDDISDWIQGSTPNQWEELDDLLPQHFRKIGKTV